MSEELKTLKVDDKWSILYDAGKNDRPLEWHRHKKLHTPFSEYNADVAMFYAFQEATDRIEELEKQNASLEAKLDSLVPALSYEGMRTDEAEAKLAIAMVGLVQSRDELDQYSQNEYPSDHPVHERYRKRDYDANPARIAIAKINGEQL